MWDTYSPVSNLLHVNTSSFKGNQLPIISTYNTLSFPTPVTFISILVDVPKKILPVKQYRREDECSEL